VTVNQPIIFQFGGKPLTQVTVTALEATDISGLRHGVVGKPRPVSLGLIFANTVITFERAEGSPIMLTGKSKSKIIRQSIINPDWDFSKMGIGGLDTQFNAIFRRAFASRVFPPEIMEQLGCKHVKGDAFYLILSKRNC
jgi:vesicle-fusing ATPase